MSVCFSFPVVEMKEKKEKRKKNSYRRASRRDRVVGPHEPGLDADKRSSHVGDRIRNEKGRDLLEALFDEVFHAVLEDSEAAHAGADEHAAARLVELLEALGADGEAGVDEGLFRGDEGVREAVVVAARVLLVDETVEFFFFFLNHHPRERVKRCAKRDGPKKGNLQQKNYSPLVVKVADLRGKVGRELARVEAVDRADGRRAREQLVVERVDVVAEARGDAHARDDDALGGVGARGDGGGADGDGAGWRREG